MADNWDISAVVTNANTPPINFNTTHSENVNSEENPLEFLNHLTFGDDDDGLHCFSELEPPKINCSQDVQDNFCYPFSVPTSTDNESGGENIHKPPSPPKFVHDFQVNPPQNHSPFVFQQQQQQNYQMSHTNFSAISSPNSFICDNFQQQRPFFRPLFQRQSAPPVPIPRLPIQSTSCARSRTRNRNQKRKVEKIPADKLNSDPWSWRKYGQKPIKGSPHPRNYYRCSSSKGCTARKQVEKSNAEQDVFIICYAGEHNHVQPTVNRQGSRFKLLGRNNDKEYETSSIAPPVIENGYPTTLSATNLSQTSTPVLSVSEDKVDGGAETNGHAGMNNGNGL